VGRPVELGRLVARDQVDRVGVGVVNSLSRSSRTDPRRPHQLSRWTDNAARRPTAPHPPCRTRRASAPRARQHRQSNPASNPHRRTPRRDLDRRTHTGLLTTPLPPRTSLPHRAGRPALSPSEATGRSRSDLDSPNAGAITIQVRGGGTNTRSSFGRYVVRSFPAIPSPSSVTRPSPSWLSVNNVSGFWPAAVVRQSCCRSAMRLARRRRDRGRRRNGAGSRHGDVPVAPLVAELFRCRWRVGA
jgi:hypothetical protein